MQGVEDFYERARAIAAGAGSASEKLAGLIRAHLAPLLDRADYVRVFLNERQYLPRASRHRIAKWSRGIERVIEGVIKDGIRRGEFAAGTDPRLATLAVLGMLNAASAWYGKEDASLERIAGAFVRLTINGLANPKSARALTPAPDLRTSSATTIGSAATRF